jgi:DNA-binding NarL/FixJ family response regulator
MSRPQVVISARKSEPDSFGVLDLDALAHDSYELDGCTVRVDVADGAAAATVLALVLRGASAELHVCLDPPERAQFIDQLKRIADVRESTPPALDEEQLELLRLLRDGASLGQAAAHVGLSRRTADRRLARARATLGVSTTTEAVARLEERRWLPRW